MGLFKAMKSWFHKLNQRGKKPDALMAACPHGAAKHRFTVLVFGMERSVDKSPMCEFCTGEYLNRYATLCGECERIIFPGDSVAQACMGASHPYTHLTTECCPSGALWCGTWGEGRLITLHEIDPEEFPHGTGSAMGHVMASGKMLIRNIK